MTTETPGGSPPDSPVAAGLTARSLFTRPMVLAGVGGACVLGLAIGLLARPQLATDTREPGSMKPVEQMQIEIDRDEPLPAVKGAKLELLPPGLTVPRPTTPTPPARVLPPREIAPPARPLARGPSFDCADSASAAEELVCGDAALAAQDRRLADAWRRALDAGRSHAPSAPPAAALAGRPRGRRASRAGRGRRPVRPADPGAGRGRRLRTLRRRAWVDRNAIQARN
jgi:hypothetical protein